MYGLLALIARYSGTITFILLEAFCMYLVVQYNVKQKEIYVNSSNIFSGTIYQRYDKIMDYANLSRDNEVLAGEVATLYARLGNAKFSEYLVRDSSFVRDSLGKIKQQYTYIAANVVNNSITLPNNYITLNRGSNHGVKAGMGVMTPQGVIGIVRNVTENFSEVMSILHQQAKISASLRRTSYFGTLFWRDQSNPLMLSLEQIPKHAEIGVGDTIQTSGYSYIFPEGIAIGKVETCKVEAGSNYKVARIKLFEDLAKLRYVYIVNNLMRNEQEYLIKETQQLK